MLFVGSNTEGCIERSQMKLAPHVRVLVDLATTVAYDETTAPQVTTLQTTETTTMEETTAQSACSTNPCKNRGFCFPDIVGSSSVLVE